MLLHCFIRSLIVHTCPSNSAKGLLRKKQKMTKYLTVTETAKLIRVALKEAFPGIKFSVKSSSYSGGASIDVSYKDGPTNAQVKSIVSRFEGAYFDGMTDYKGYKYNQFNGEEVSFGANFIFVRRDLSVGLLQLAVDKVFQEYGLTNDYKIVEGYNGAYVQLDNNQQIGNGYYYIDQKINLTTEEISYCATVESITANKVVSLGDDGYGYGAVGRLAA